MHKFYIIQAKLRWVKDKIGIILAIIFLLFLWGAYIGNFFIVIFYFIFPDAWVDAVAMIFYKIYPGLLEPHECVSDYMGGCN